jgi:uncharacterized protein (DUF983 family)
MALDHLPTNALVKRISNFKFSTLGREKLEEVYKTLASGTTRVCPGCLNQNLLELRTLNEKVCTDCGEKIPWHLTEGQKPIR